MREALRRKSSGGRARLETLRGVLPEGFLKLILGHPFSPRSRFGTHSYLAADPGRS